MNRKSQDLQREIASLKRTVRRLKARIAQVEKYSSSPGKPFPAARPNVWRMDPRIPPNGTTLRGTYHRKVYEVLVSKDGFVWRSKLYRSLSAIAQEITGSACNGFAFFKLLRKTA